MGRATAVLTQDQFYLITDHRSLSLYLFLRNVIVAALVPCVSVTRKGGGTSIPAMSMSTSLIFA